MRQTSQKLCKKLKLLALLNLKAFLGTECLWTRTSSLRIVKRINQDAFHKTSRKPGTFLDQGSWGRVVKVASVPRDTGYAGNGSCLVTWDQVWTTGWHWEGAIIPLWCTGDACSKEPGTGGRWALKFWERCCFVIYSLKGYNFLILTSVTEC